MANEIEDERSIEEIRADLDKLMRKLDLARAKIGEELFKPDGDIRDRFGYIKTWTF